ncbi:uncharacterized protein METZ01_LOCUS134546 [marine metagenome]|uniref:Uncharacterized protein n=1 Tax=marine metagenome TaxID=408172 RepID=A0A381YYH9_9ZZZZ
MPLSLLEYSILKISLFDFKSPSYIKLANFFLSRISRKYDLDTG